MDTINNIFISVFVTLLVIYLNRTLGFYISAFICLSSFVLIILFGFTTIYIHKMTVKKKHNHSF